MKTGSRAMILLALLVAGTMPAELGENDEATISRMLFDSSRALQAGNAEACLVHFDRDRFADYPRLETQIVALTRQAEVASSVALARIKPDGGAYRVEVDWILQLKPLGAPGPVETRREVLAVYVVRIDKRWKIVDLRPVDFFRAR